jgi:hypothetical protein
VSTPVRVSRVLCARHMPPPAAFHRCRRYPISLHIALTQSPLRPNLRQINGVWNLSADHGNLGTMYVNIHVLCTM